MSNLHQNSFVPDAVDGTATIFMQVSLFLISKTLWKNSSILSSAFKADE